MMGRGGMTAGAAEVETGRIHVHIKGAIRFEQGRIKIAMLDPITAAAFEMAGAAGRP